MNWSKRIRTIGGKRPENIRILFEFFLIQLIYLKTKIQNSIIIQSSCYFLFFFFWFLYKIICVDLFEACIWYVYYLFLSLWILSLVDSSLSLNTRLARLRVLGLPPSALGSLFKFLIPSWSFFLALKY